MKLAEIKEFLNTVEKISFQLPNGDFVPQHFHVTEVGKITKNFIDCGGTLRHEEVVSFQLWNANDYQHRLAPQKLLSIITLAEKSLGLNPELNIEVEYQGNSIEKYDLEFQDATFLLTSKQTDCLAKDKCGITEEKPKVKLVDLQNSACCPPNSNCC